MCGPPPAQSYPTYPAYKPADTEWLESIPAHWQLRRLKTLACVYLSNVDKTSVEGQVPVRLCNYVDVYHNERITDTIAFMAATATPEQVGRFSLRKGDVLITKDSESWNDIAVPAVLLEDLSDVLCGYHLALVRPRDSSCDGRFLRYVLAAIGPRDQFHVAANGITRFGLGGDAIRAGLIPTPPVEEQRDIAAVLDRETARIDGLVSKKERLIELLQEKRAALITRAVTKGLDPTVPMKDSGVEWLGEIPAHWQLVPSTWLFTEGKQRALDGDQQLSATQKYGVIPQAEFERLEGRQVVHAFLHLDQRKHVEIDDFVMSMRSFEGGLERVRARGCVRSSYVVLRSSTKGHVGYFLYLFKSSAYIQALRATSNFIRDGQDLNFENFRLVKLPLVPSREQETIAAFLDRETSRLDVLITKVRDAIERLKELRTSLISAAVTGKIDVRAA